MNFTEYLQESVSLAAIRRHIQVLEGVRHPVADPEALNRAADYIAESLTESAYDVADHGFMENGRLYRNIIATRRGEHLPDERVVVLAHYDTVADSPGADDNASGVAVLLEIARVLSRFRFERTIHLIAVSLEENQHGNDPGSGTRGSRALAAYARENGWNISGVVVLESVAYAGDTIVQTVPPGISVPVPEFGNFIAVVGNKRSCELAEGFSLAIERYRIDCPHLELVVPGNGDLLPDTRRSDHAPFWDEGFAAIMITDTTNFRSIHNHQPTDTLATLNLDFATNVCRAATGLIHDTARRIP